MVVEPTVSIIIVGNDGRVVTAIVQVRRRGYMWIGASGEHRVQGPLDAEGVRALLVEAGADPEHPGLTIEAAAIAREAGLRAAPVLTGARSWNEVRDDIRAFGDQSLSTARNSGPSGWATVPLLLLFFAIWAFGVVRLLRRYGGPSRIAASSSPF